MHLSVGLRSEFLSLSPSSLYIIHLHLLHFAVMKGYNNINNNSMKLIVVVVIIITSNEKILKM